MINKKGKHNKPKKPCMNHCKSSHIPNQETVKVLKDTDTNKNLMEYETIDDFWESLPLLKQK